MLRVVLVNLIANAVKFRRTRLRAEFETGFGILLASALCMALKWAEMFHWLAASIRVLLFSATTVSWELLKRIANR
jgi:signal transduction histidine kinase